MKTQIAGADLTWSEVHESLLPWMRADRFTNLRYLAREYLGIGSLLALGTVTYQAWSSQTLSISWFLALSAVLVFSMAVFQHRLSGLAHDASHYLLFSNRLVNDLVSDLLLLFPLVAMTQQYRNAHLGHHQYVNDPERDPDLIRLNHPDPLTFPISKAAFLKRYLAAPLWPPTLLRYLFGRAKAANLGDPGREIRSVYSKRVTRCMRGAYWLSILALTHLTGSWPVFGLFWVLPLLTVYPFLMQLREIAHHSNAPDDGDLTNSRVFVVHPFLRFCVFPYGQEFHLTHHLFAMIPHYRIADAHALLLRCAAYRENVVICHGYFFRKAESLEPCLLDLLSLPAETFLTSKRDQSTLRGSAPHSVDWSDGRDRAA